MTTTHPTLGEARLPRNPLLSEVLALVSKQKTKAKKIQILKENESLHLKSVLIWNFDESVKSMLPDGDVPFNKNEAPAGTEHTSLASEARKLYHFIVGGNNTINKLKKETMFIQMLEGLHADDAEVLMAIKNKNLNNVYKGLTAQMVKETFGWNDDFVRIAQ